MKTQMSLCPGPMSTARPWRGPMCLLGSPGGCGQPPGHARGTDAEAMRGGFGGWWEGVAVKRCWGPRLMESGQLGGRSTLVGPKGERRPKAAVIHQVRVLERTAEPLVCGHPRPSRLQGGRCCRDSAVEAKVTAGHCTVCRPLPPTRVMGSLTPPLRGTCEAQNPDFPSSVFAQGSAVTHDLPGATGGVNRVLPGSAPRGPTASDHTQTKETPYLDPAV